MHDVAEVPVQKNFLQSRVTDLEPLLAWPEGVTRNETHRELETGSERKRTIDAFALETLRYFSPELVKSSAMEI
jgi:hypothetical protein